MRSGAFEDLADVGTAEHRPNRRSDVASSTARVAAIAVPAMLGKARRSASGVAFPALSTSRTRPAVGLQV